MAIQNRPLVEMTGNQATFVGLEFEKETSIMDKFFCFFRSNKNPNKTSTIEFKKSLGLLDRLLSSKWKEIQVCNSKTGSFEAIYINTADLKGKLKYNLKIKKADKPTVSNVKSAISQLKASSDSALENSEKVVQIFSKVFPDNRQCKYTSSITKDDLEHDLEEIRRLFD